MKIVAIEGTLVDHVCDLTDLSSSDLMSAMQGGNLFKPIRVSIGGTAIQFAIAARNSGFDHASVIGKIGGIALGSSIVPDAPGQAIIDYLKNHGVEPLLAYDLQLETGKTLLLYLPNGQRLLITDQAASAAYTSADATADVAARLAEADLVHFSAYVLLQPSWSDAIIDLLSMARRGNAIIALDIVPHKIYRSYGWEQMSMHLNGLVDFAIVELATAHQLVGLGYLDDRKPVDAELLDAIFSVLGTTFPAVAVNVGRNHFIVRDKKRQSEFTSQLSMPTDAEQRGHTARLQAELLGWFMSNLE